MIFNIVTVFFFLHLIGQTFTGFCRWRHIWVVWEHNWTCRPITGGCRCPFWPVIKWVRACGAQSSQTPRRGGPVNDLWGGHRVTRSLRGQWASSWCWGGIGWACLLPKFGKFCLLLFYQIFQAIKPQRKKTTIMQRVLLGWWLLQLTVKMLANLRLTINIFSLSSTDLFLKVISILQLTVKICQILRHTAKLLVVLRITVNPIETLHEFRILFCDKEYEGKLPNYLIFPTPRGYPVNFCSLYQGYALGEGWEERDNDDFRTHWRITRNMVPLHVRFTSKLQIVV